MTLIDSFKQYLAYYELKNLDAISAMFAQDIHLRDWKISVKGKTAAVAETKKNFENAHTISIDVLNVMSNENCVSGELKIVVDNSEILFVTDVLSFDDQGNIQAIRAYIGRHD